MNYKKLIAPLFLVVLLSGLGYAQRSYAQGVGSQAFALSRVTAVQNEQEQDVAGNIQRQQDLKVKLLFGPDKGKEVDVTFREIATKNTGKLRVGSYVLAVKIDDGSGGPATYQIADRFRLPMTALALVVLIVLAIIFLGRKSLLALASIVLSMLIVAVYVVPSIINSAHPLLTDFLGSALIALIITVLVFGYKHRHVLGFFTTLLNLLILLAIGYGVFSLANLNGLGTQESLLVQSGLVDQGHLKELLLAGFLIGLTGILVPLNQLLVKKMWKLAEETGSSVKALFWQGVKEMKKMVWYYLLALWFLYIGITMPLYVLFPRHPIQPVWVLLNTEFISEELMRGLLGSIALILSVVITSLIVAYYIARKGKPGETITVVEETVIIENPTI